MMRLEAAAPRDFGWLQTRAGCLLTATARAMKVVDASGRILGMVAYDDFTKGSCVVHQAVDAPVAWRRLIPAVFIFAFDVVGVSVAVGTVPANNKRAMRLTKRLGFRETYRVRDGWAPGVDMVLHELRREDCVAKGWLKAKEEAA